MMAQLFRNTGVKRKTNPADDATIAVDLNAAKQVLLKNSCNDVTQTHCNKFRKVDLDINVDEQVKKISELSRNSSKKSDKKYVDTDFLDKNLKPVKWQEVRGENLFLQHTQLFSKEEASVLFKQCEQELSYNVGDLAKVKLFGKWIDIPRKQVAHGDPGLTYTFSGNTVPARPWTPFLINIRDQIAAASGYSYNFVLINRYKDGHDYMGEHKDDEKDLVAGHPIASLTLGQPRDFVFKHQDSRGKRARRKIDTITLQLNHGMLLLMNHPTNSYWYHSLPRRTRAHGVRINMTFRKMEPSHCKPA